MTAISTHTNRGLTWASMVVVLCLLLVSVPGYAQTRDLPVSATIQFPQAQQITPSNGCAPLHRDSVFRPVASGPSKCTMVMWANVRVMTSPILVHGTGNGSCSTGSIFPNVVIVTGSVSWYTLIRKPDQPTTPRSSRSINGEPRNAHAIRLSCCT